MHSVGGSGLGASDKHGGSPGGLPGGNGDSHPGSSGFPNGGSHGAQGSPNGDIGREERIRAVRRHAERAARELDRERNDSVLSLAQALGSIDRDELTAQFEARLAFLERQVERLVGRREEVDRGIDNELHTMRARVTEAIGAVEAAGEADRRDREAVEGRIRAMVEALESRVRSAIEESEQRTAEATASAVAVVETAGETDRRDREALEARIRANLEAVEGRVQAALEAVEGQVRSAIEESEQRTAETTAEAVAVVEASGEVDRRDREAVEGRIRATLAALEGRIRTALEESEQRTAEASRALRETLLTSWEQTVESERRERDRTHIEALERELSERAELARSAIERIRHSLDSQVAVTVQAAHAVAEAALSGVVDRLDPEAPGDAPGSAAPRLTAAAGGGAKTGPGSVTEWLDELIRRQHAPPPYEPPAVRSTDHPPVWEIETPQ